MKIASWCRANAMPLIAVLAAAVTACFVPPDAAYAGYFDWKTLSCLFCVLAVRISALGAEMQVAGRMSYGGELLAAAAGPAVNLLLAAALGLLGRWWEPLYLLAGAQAVLGCFNLLPILPLDGGRMLWLALCWGTDPFLADRVAQAVSLAAAGLLAAAGAALARRSPFLLWTAAALLVCAAAPCIKRRRSVYASHKGR